MTGEVSDDYLAGMGASDDDEELEVVDTGDEIEVDPETEAKLKEQGLEIPPHEPKEKIAEPPKQVPLEEHPAPEPEEKPLILGKYKTYADLEKAYKQLEPVVEERSRLARQVEDANRAWNNLAQHPDGARIIGDLMAGRNGPQQQMPKIPKGPQLYEWLNENPENFETYLQVQNQPLAQQITQLGQAVNAINAYLEDQAVRTRHGDTLNELQPYIERVSQELGPHAQYYPREQLIRMAKGMKYDDDLSARQTQQQTDQQKQQATEQHREKAIAASVESANVASEPAGRVIDVNKLPLNEFRKKLIELGAKVNDYR